jgi:hypothetical protein
MRILIILLVILLLLPSVLCYIQSFNNKWKKKYYCNTNNNIIIKDVFEGDIVEYKNNNKDIELAAVIKVNKDKSIILHPLCLRPSDDIDDNNKDFINISSLLSSFNNQNKEIELYYDETINSISINEYDNIINILRDGVILTQRVIEDRISNPHGEHSEDCWLLNLNSVIFSNNNLIKLNIRLPEH